MPQKRPFGVTLLLWLVLSLSAWGAVRFLAAFRWWNVLQEFDARLTPLYLSVTGAGWIIVGIVFLWSLLGSKVWARLAIPGAVFLWVLEYWIERLFFESARDNLFFALLATMLLLVVAIISAFNQKTKRFFIRSEEHDQPNKSTDIARA